MLIPEIAPYIMDNNNCNFHGKDIYMQMMEYVSYDGEYDTDTNTFSYIPDGASHADSGDMYWLCGHCDRTVKWVGEHPQVEVE
jgi:hypothetical protein